MSVSLPVPRRNVYFALLGDSAQRRRMVLVLLLMAAASATEGIGLVLAVPLIAALNGNGGSMILQWPTRILPSIGSAHTLSSLLAAFIVLVTLRALLMLARTLVAEQLQIDVVDGLRSRAWRALLAMDWKMLARQHRSDHASLLISDINRAGFALQQALAAAAAMLTLVALALAGLALSPRAAFGALLAGSIVLAAFAPLRRLARALGQDLGQAYASVHGS